MEAVGRVLLQAGPQTVLLPPVYHQVWSRLRVVVLLSDDVSQTGRVGIQAFEEPAETGQSVRGPRRNGCPVTYLKERN